MSDPKVIYLGPACQEQGQSSGREWCQDDVWDTCECGHESVRYVLGSDFDQVTAERDALLVREAELTKELERQKRYVEINANSAQGKHAEGQRYRDERDALQLRLNAADQRIDELECDKHRLDALDSNCWDVRFNSSPNGDAGDSSVNIEVVGHWMDQPFERVIGENYSENLRAAIDQAMAAPAYPPARPEYPEPEPDADDDWHMNPCKQGHRDVGASGGVAACNQCDEKIEAGTTQEAFERWNASHPEPQA